MVLNKKQKKFLFTAILGSEDNVKLFETNDLKWLLSQKVIIGKEDQYGWRPLIVEGEEITGLNFKGNPFWSEVLDNIGEYEQCQWCGDWVETDSIVFRRKGFTRLCDHCNSYLISREMGSYGR